MKLFFFLSYEAYRLVHFREIIVQAFEFLFRPVNSFLIHHLPPLFQYEYVDDNGRQAKRDHNDPYPTDDGGYNRAKHYRHKDSDGGRDPPTLGFNEDVTIDNNNKENIETHPEDIRIG